MVGPELQFAALTDVGRQREHNEDNFLVDKKIGLFVVCDGMGGHAAGEVASALAVRTVHEEIKKEAELLQDYVEGRKESGRVTRRDITNLLEFAVNRASSRVHAEAVKDPKKRGMGTTLAATLLLGHEAFIIWVGDSRVYHLRAGEITQLTEDHNVYNELIRRKKMSKEQVEKVAQKNAITRAVGVYEHIEPETLVVDLVAGDRLLLCSDGYEIHDERLGLDVLVHADRAGDGVLLRDLLTTRDVLGPALRDAASAIVLVHNHPSGDPRPSPEDVRMTRAIADACEVVGVPLFDHVVVARGGASSLFESGAP